MTTRYVPWNSQVDI